MNDSKVLVIWGMHRSGTSLVASWLHGCGLDIGSDLLGATPGNKRGHYEDMDFVRLHNRILAANGIGWGGQAVSTPIEVPPDLLSEVRELVDERSRKPQWGWKDPRTCLLTQEYLELLPSAHHLIVYRDYGLVVDSLMRRSSNWYARRARSKSGPKRVYHRLRARLHGAFLLPRAKNRYLAAWICYNENLLRLAERVGRNAIALDVRDLVSDGAAIFETLQSWGFALEYQPAEDFFDRSMMVTKPREPLAFDSALKLRADQAMVDLAALGVARSRS